MRTLVTAAALVAITAPVVAQDAVSIKVADSEKYGEYLTTDAGRPVYLFTADTRATDGETPEISCTSDPCLNVWPLVTAAGTPQVGDGVAEEMLGTMAYDGQTVVTYSGWPLYYFARDQGADAPQGQGIESFGGEWFLVTPGGEKVQSE